ncbi:hypothetical protein [Aliiroseovarius crassostreae]|uniref:hypothetical protein n=1 Tax=Aliiroseovarius crassostreae TaxID=154981 RepID=UPI003C7CD187
MNDCIQTVNHKKILFKEKNRQAIFDNPTQREFSKAQVDGCLINQGERCDGFLSDENKIWFIELKGKDVPKAASQICSAAEVLKEYCDDKEVHAVIVATKCPATSGQLKDLRALKQIKGFEPSRLKLSSRKAIIKVD